LAGIYKEIKRLKKKDRQDREKRVKETGKDSWKKRKEKWIEERID
jgi:hypothetical protein